MFLPGEPCGQRSLEGYSPQGGKKLDTTEATWHKHVTSLFTIMIDSEIGTKDGFSVKPSLEVKGSLRQKY